MMSLLALALKDPEFAKEAQRWAEDKTTQRILRLYREDTLRPIGDGGDLNARLTSHEKNDGKREAISRLLSLAHPQEVSASEDADYGTRDALRAMEFTDDQIDALIAHEQGGTGK